MLYTSVFCLILTVHPRTTTGDLVNPLIQTNSSILRMGGLAGIKIPNHDSVNAPLSRLSYRTTEAQRTIRTVLMNTNSFYMKTCSCKYKRSCLTNSVLSLKSLLKFRNGKRKRKSLPIYLYSSNSCCF